MADDQFAGWWAMSGGNKKGKGGRDAAAYLSFLFVWDECEWCGWLDRVDRTGWHGMAYGNWEIG